METKPEWYYRQSATIPYRVTEDGPEVMLITSRKRGRWILPKGIVEPGLTAAESAAKETFEEAGVRGRITEPALGIYRHEKWGGLCTVSVFALAVETECENWPERAYRRRRWLSVEEAVERIDQPSAEGLIRALAEWLARERSSTLVVDQ